MSIRSLLGEVWRGFVAYFNEDPGEIAMANARLISERVVACKPTAEQLTDELRQAVKILLDRTETEVNAADDLLGMAERLLDKSGHDETLIGQKKGSIRLARIAYAVTCAQEFFVMAQEDSSGAMAMASYRVGHEHLKRAVFSLGATLDELPSGVEVLQIETDLRYKWGMPRAF